MRYALIQRPETDITKLEIIRKKYDPTSSLINAHATIVFPFPSEDMDEQKLITAITQMTSKVQPFNLRFDDLEISWDQWLFLTPSVGRDEFIKLHDELYKLEDIRPYLRPDIAFIPHISLGFFAKRDQKYDLSKPTKLPLDQEKYNRARKEIESNDFTISYEATKIELVIVDDEAQTTKTVNVFELGSFGS